jgi:ABC-type transport system substrate-binding protein
MIIFILLVGGIIVGIGKSHQSITKQPIVNNEELPNEAYIDELKIPLIEVDSLNPLVTKNEQVFQVLKLIYEPLFEYASNETLEKILVQNFSKLDSKTYIMTLKPDIKWHRGGDFTSSDVAFTIQTLQEYELIFSPNVANIDRVEILDDASLKLYSPCGKREPGKAKRR